jgi:hypothetical protein
MDLRPTKIHGKCDQQNPKIIPLYAFPTMLGPALEGLYSLPFCTQPMCYMGVSDKFHGYWTFKHSLAQTLMFDFVSFKSFLSNPKSRL